MCEMHNKNEAHLAKCRETERQRDLEIHRERQREMGRDSQADSHTEKVGLYAGSEKDTSRQVGARRDLISRANGMFADVVALRRGQCRGILALTRCHYLCIQC